LLSLINTDRDIIIQTQSGTGKTASYVITSLQKLDEQSTVTQVLILCPTRELAYNVSHMLKNLSKYLNTKICIIIGGIYIQETVKELSNHPQIVIATPGRCLDMIKKGRFDISSIKMVVFDEIDEMLARGFGETLEELFQCLGKEMRFMIFSAIISTDIEELYNKRFNNPSLIKYKPATYILEGVRQYYIKLKEEWKLETLIDLLKSNVTPCQTIVYCNRRKTVDFLTEELMKNNFLVAKYHADLTKFEKEICLNEFKYGNVRILLTTDVYLREKDDIHLLINYDLCSNAESYIVRVGRRSRCGIKTIVISFVTPADELILEQIQKYFSTVIEELPMDWGNFL
jgi:translation initiation factor 4A